MKSTNVIGTIPHVPYTSKKKEKKEVIVIADDDPGILEAMKLMLEFYGFNVITIGNEEIVPQLIALQPKLLFLDICLSGVDGRHVCKTLKSLEQTKNISVVMISARCDLISTAKEWGADDYLEKPFNMQDIIMKVNKYLLN